MGLIFSAMVFSVFSLGVVRSIFTPVLCAHSLYGDKELVVETNNKITSLPYNEQLAGLGGDGGMVGVQVWFRGLVAKGFEVNMDMWNMEVWVFQMDVGVGVEM